MFLDKIPVIFSQESKAKIRSYIDGVLAEKKTLEDVILTMKSSIEKCNSENQSLKGNVSELELELQKVHVTIDVSYSYI